MQPSGDTKSLASGAERVRILWTMAGTTRSTKAVALGARMRDARIGHRPDVSARALNAELGVKHPTVSRWETGERAPRPEDVAAYLMAVNAPAELREELVEMARDTSGAPWLSVGMPEAQGQLAALLELERSAKTITHVAPLLMPGLLQTGDYARAVMVATGIPANLIEMRVAVRVGRRDALTRRDPVHLKAFIWEPVLRQRIGGDDVMTDQLGHLLEMAKRPNIDIRIIPTRTEWNPGFEGPFIVFEFADGRDPVAHVENKYSGLFLDHPDEVGPYVKDGKRAEEVAISSKESEELIASVINGKETTR